MPGETAAPGTASGKTGTPTARAAGAPFTVTVNAVDANWNLINNTTNRTKRRQLKYLDYAQAHSKYPVTDLGAL